MYTHQILLKSLVQLSNLPDVPRQRPLSVGLQRRVLLLRSAMRYLHHPAASLNGSGGFQNDG